MISRVSTLTNSIFILFNIVYFGLFNMNIILAPAVKTILDIEKVMEFDWVIVRACFGTA